jgi:hypothetical protein
MKLYPNSIMTIMYHSADASDECPCVVKISEAEILVEYEDDGFCQYVGRSRGVGHYELQAPALNGHASLHMFEGSEHLEGTWVEGTYRGMWRIRLN